MGCSGCDMTGSPTYIWAAIDRTTPPSPSGSMTHGKPDEGLSCLSDSRPTRGLCPFATGTLKAELLEVRSYGDSMQHSDFENAVYRRSQ